MKKGVANQTTCPRCFIKKVVYNFQITSKCSSSVLLGFNHFIMNKHFLMKFICSLLMNRAHCFQFKGLLTRIFDILALFL